MTEVQKNAFQQAFVEAFQQQRLNTMQDTFASLGLSPEDTLTQPDGTEITVQAILDQAAASPPPLANFLATAIIAGLEAMEDAGQT